MLEHLFSSKTRLKLLTLFLRNPDKRYYVRELTRTLKERINSIRRELENLSKIGLLTDFREDKKRYYQVDKNFIYFQELRALILKATTMPRDKMIKLFEKAGTPKLVVLSGKFSQSPSKVDLLIVGDFKKDKVAKIVEKLEKEQGSELNYSIIKEGEFIFRRDYGDRFIKSIFDNSHTILVDKLEKKKKRKTRKPIVTL
ncbi:hypothetical protein KKC60_03775 [Patescibacteria group bacterium]|nr:hypothetical protein [Patescibacteria group bacterium]